MGETSCRINKRIYEHRRNLKRAHINNDLVKLNQENNDNFDFKDIKIFFNIHHKKCRKIVELSVISNYNTIKLRSDFFQFDSLFGLIGTEK